MASRMTSASVAAPETTRRATRARRGVHSLRCCTTSGSASVSTSDEGAGRNESGRFVLVQANVAVAVGDAGSEQMKGFFEGLELVNRRAREAVRTYFDANYTRTMESCAHFAALRSREPIRGIRKLIHSGSRRTNASPNQDGFIAMLGEDGGGGAGDLPDDWYLNVSVWRDIDAFRSFVYAGDHLVYLRRKAEWYVSDRGHVDAQ